MSLRGFVYTLPAHRVDDTVHVCSWASKCRGCRDGVTRYRFVLRVSCVDKWVPFSFYT